MRGGWWASRRHKGCPWPARNPISKTSARKGPWRACSRFVGCATRPVISVAVPPRMKQEGALSSTLRGGAPLATSLPGTASAGPATGGRKLAFRCGAPVGMKSRRSVPRRWSRPSQEGCGPPPFPPSLFCSVGQPVSALVMRPWASLVGAIAVQAVLCRALVRRSVCAGSGQPLFDPH